MLVIPCAHDAAAPSPAGPVCAEMLSVQMTRHMLLCRLVHFVQSNAHTIVANLQQLQTKARRMGE